MQGNDFVAIEGDHVEGKGNDDVRVIDAYAQDSANVPSVVCRQFRQLRELHMIRSHVEVVNEEMFEDCVNLETLVLNHNQITQLPDFLFINNPNLDTVEFLSNRLTSIGENAFVNLNMMFLDLEDNRLTVFNPQWVAASRESLIYLYMATNQIEELREDAFDGLVNLMVLDVAVNPLRTIASTAFRGLAGVRQIWLDSCTIRDVDVQWFSGLNEMRFLSLKDNQIELLRPGVFE